MTAVVDGINRDVKTPFDTQPLADQTCLNRGVLWVRVRPGFTGEGPTSEYAL